MNNFNKIKKETDLIESLTNFLAIQKYELRYEVPTLGQSADIVACKKKSYTFIEAKMHDWKRGLNQCKTHEIVADYICIAIASVHISAKLEYCAKMKGYGIIHCNPNTGICDWFVSPEINENMWFPQRKSFVNSLRDLENGN